MKRQIVIAIFSFLALVNCQTPSTEEQDALVEALNRHRSEVSSQPASWSVNYASSAQGEAQSCQRVEKFPGLSDHVSKADSNYLVDALEFWIQDGKEDEKDGCPRFACNDYHVLISAPLQAIGCGYHNCPNLGGVYVVCKYDFILN